jgi:hypothetical protein
MLNVILWSRSSSCSSISISSVLSPPSPPRLTIFYTECHPVEQEFKLFKHNYLFSQRKVEFLEDFATDIKKLQVRKRSKSSYVKFWILIS